MTEKCGPEHVIYPFPYFYQSDLVLFLKTKPLNLVSGKQTFLNSLNGGSRTSHCLPVRFASLYQCYLMPLGGPRNGLCHISNTICFNVTPQIHSEVDTYRSQ